MKAILSALTLCLVSMTVAAQQSTGTIRGRVTDQLGAVIVGAQISLADAGGATRTATTTRDGSYALAGLAPGIYTVSVTAEGFAVYERTGVEVTAGRSSEVDAELSVALGAEQVSVDAGGALSTETGSNAGGVVLRGRELDLLPDDPEELAAALQALAGTPVGIDGTQFLIDGFTNIGQPLPSRASIREVRINENPFSAENDRVGFGQIQILTRPGTDSVRGEASFNFSDESLNARNPFTTSRAPYQTRLYRGVFSGPIVKKRTSFFLNFDRREWDDNQIVNATILDAALDPLRLRQTIITPRRTTSFNSRLDHQINSNNTLTFRYSVLRSHRLNLGVGAFSLPERAYDAANSINTIELTQAAVINSAVVNEFRLQYIFEDQIDRGDNSRPTINVSSAFVGGSSNFGLASNPEGRLTVQNGTLWTQGAHTLRVGGRLRRTIIEDISPDDFGGTYTFAGGLAPRLDANDEPVVDPQGQIISTPITSLERYRRTLLFGRRGFAPTEVRRRGGGASQFTIAGGDARATAEQIDFGAYIQDDWRVRPNFTLSLGLRYEFQTNIGTHPNFAPRIAFAWSPDYASGTTKSATVLRGGFGIFFDRFNERRVLSVNRYRNGFGRLVISDPEVLASFPIAPTFDALRARYAAAQSTFRIADDLREPYMIQGAFSVEQQLPHKTTLTAAVIFARTSHALRTRNVNAPVAGRFDSQNPSMVVRPFEGAGDIYQYESSGVFEQRQLVLSLNNRFSSRATFFVNYTLGSAMGDTDGVDSFPAYSYDLRSEYGRASTDRRHNLAAGGTFILPFGVRLNPLVFASSGSPFNITTGVDANGDGIFTDRPTFVVDESRPGLYATPFGTFDAESAPGAQFIPRNYGESLGYFIANLNVNRVFAFGSPRSGSAASSRSTAASGDGRYRLTLGVRVLNLFNRVNFDSPIGDLGSPFFGRSVATAGGFGAASVGNATAGNRRIETQVRFEF